MQTLKSMYLLWPIFGSNCLPNIILYNGLVLQHFHLSEYTKHLTSKKDRFLCCLKGWPKTCTNAIQWVDVTTMLCASVHINSCGQTSQQNLGQKLCTGIVARPLLWCCYTSWGGIKWTGSFLLNCSIFFLLASTAYHVTKGASQSQSMLRVASKELERFIFIYSFIWEYAPLKLQSLSAIM